MSSSGGGHSNPLRRRRGEDVRIDFTAMIDCMFLLLMFNMIAYTITGSTSVELPEARFAKGADVSKATEIMILSNAATGGATYHIGDAGAPKASLQDVRAAIERAAAAGERRVVIKAEKRVPYKFVQEIGALASAVGDRSLYIAVAQPR